MQLDTRIMQIQGLQANEDETLHPERNPPNI
jgi:hypothetical protein